MSSLPASFWERLPQRTDSELADALMHPENYEQEALLAIKAEWEKREIPPLEKTAIAASHAQEEEEVGRRARQLWSKTEFFCLYLASVLFRKNALRAWCECKFGGYQRKARHCVLAMGLAFATWVLLFVIFTWLAA